MGAMNSICWLSFSIVIRDIYLIIPNAVGVAISVMNFIIYLWATGVLPDCT
jgi:hypothetical protein